MRVREREGLCNFCSQTPQLRLSLLIMFWLGNAKELSITTFLSLQTHTHLHTRTPANPKKSEGASKTERLSALDNFVVAVEWSRSRTVCVKTGTTRSLLLPANSPKKKNSLSLTLSPLSCVCWESCLYLWTTYSRYFMAFSFFPAQYQVYLCWAR